MKQVISFCCFIAVVLFLNACQKDTDNTDTSPSSPVGFTLGTQSHTDYKLLISPSSQSITGLLNIKVQSGTAAAATRVKLADSTAYLVNRYNTANGTSILPMPADRWSIPAELVIAQGGTSASGTITVTHTDGLDFNKLYAIGITIGSNNGYTIPDSSRNLLIVLRVANILDGRYSMKGRYYSPSTEPGFAPHVFQVELHTAGPLGVSLYWPFASMYTTPVTSGGTAFCCLANNALGIATVASSSLVGTYNGEIAGPVYAPLSAYNSVSYTNYYDAATGTVYLAFGSNLGAGGVMIPGVSRVWIDTLTYLGPR